MKPFHIIFCAAVPLEVKSLCRILEIPVPDGSHPISHGKYASFNVTVLASGVGIERMMKCLHKAQPMTRSCWVSYGLAGALSPQCKNGEVYYGNTVQYLHHDEHHGLPLPGLDFPEKDVLLCNGELAATVEHKAELHQMTGASLVDMESYSVAVMAMQREEPFFWIRGISDAHDEPLPMDLLHCLDERGYPSVWQSIYKLCQKPSLLLTAIRLGKRANQLQHDLAVKALQIIKKISEI